MDGKSPFKFFLFWNSWSLLSSFKPFTERSLFQYFCILDMCVFTFSALKRSLCQRISSSCRTEVLLHEKSLTKSDYVRAHRVLAGIDLSLKFLQEVSKWRDSTILTPTDCQSQASFEINKSWQDLLFSLSQTIWKHDKGTRGHQSLETFIAERSFQLTSWNHYLRQTDSISIRTLWCFETKRFIEFNPRAARI